MPQNVRNRKDMSCKRESRHRSTDKKIELKSQLVKNQTG